MSATAGTAEGCDGAFWHIVKTETSQATYSRVVTTLYKYENSKKIKPNENHGFYKYDVLMIQNGTKDAEFISAYIGDVDAFINNQAANGFVGVLVKKGVIPKKAEKNIFNVVLHNLSFTDKNIKSILTKVK